jgi:hypothetical protein
VAKGEVGGGGASYTPAPACHRLCFLPRAFPSLGSSTVENATQVTLQKQQSSRPRIDVTVSMQVKVESICIWSFASACHLASQNNNVMTISLCEAGRRPSKTAIAHRHILHVNQGHLFICNGIIYLQDIFVIPGSESLHCRSIRAEATDGASTIPSAFAGQQPHVIHSAHKRPNVCSAHVLFGMLECNSCSYKHVASNTKSTPAFVGRLDEYPASLPVLILVNRKWTRSNSKSTSTLVRSLLVPWGRILSYWTYKRFSLKRQSPRWWIDSIAICDEELPFSSLSLLQIAT